jgi:hypothetical protein
VFALIDRSGTHACGVFRNQLPRSANWSHSEAEQRRIAELERENRELHVAPSTYYAAVSRPPSARRQRDEHVKIWIARVHRANFGVYGIENVWRELNREGTNVGRRPSG